MLGRWKLGVKMLLLLSLTLCLAVSSSSSSSSSSSEEANCTVIEPDKGLTFEQYTSSDVVFSRLLGRASLEARIINANYTGFGFSVNKEDINNKVGKHDIKVHLKPGDECLQVNYVIKTVNECTAPKGKPWRHQCHLSTECQDTEESYNCVCPEGKKGEQGTGLGKCTNHTSTHDCCGGSEACRSHFVCVGSEPIRVQDECGGMCVKEAQCILNESKNAYDCVCRDKMFGNGRHCPQGSQPPKAIFDSNGTLQGYLAADQYCGCQPRIINYCIGVECPEHASCEHREEGYECACEEGYEMEGKQCVDRRAVGLVLQGPPVVNKIQGDTFEDPFVSIKDENGMLKEARKVSIFYDDPALHGETLDQIGAYKISYTVEAKWTKQPVQTIYRTINISDINECSLVKEHPKYERWHARCHPWAECQNTEGSYECVCKKGTTGDGADEMTRREEGKVHRPSNWVNGSGCVDIQPPVLKVTEWGKQFRVCKCEGLGGPDLPVPQACRSRDFGMEIWDLLKNDSSLLCSEGWPCYEAYDIDPNGKKENLTSQVTVGNKTEELEVEGSVRHFVLPLSVTDRANNTQRSELKFSVEEVSLSNVPEDLRGGTCPTPPTPPLTQQTESDDADNEGGTSIGASILFDGSIPIDVTTSKDGNTPRDGSQPNAADDDEEEEEEEGQSTPPSRASSYSSSSSSSSSPAASPSTTTQAEGERQGQSKAREEQKMVSLVFVIMIGVALVWMCLFKDDNRAPTEVRGIGSSLSIYSTPGGLSTPSSAFVYHESPTPNRSRPDMMPMSASPMRPLRAPLTRTPLSNF